MNWRRKRPSEIDHELIWLPVSVVCFAGLMLWRKLGLPLPGCVFHELTHHACLTCGATRSLLALCGGHLAGAFRWNPLVFCALIGILLFDLYAVIVLLFNTPRLRFDNIPPGAAARLRIAAVIVLAANWIYLLRCGI